MNSIEIAKKLIAENDKDIEEYRDIETASRKRIDELQKKIETMRKVLDRLESDLAHEEQYLADTKAEKKEYLVDNLALKLLIAEGGGLDMLD